MARLFLTSLEASDTAGARRWCDELGQRHSQQAAAGYCDLMLLAWSPTASRDDVVRGWAEIDALSPAVRSSPWGPRLSALMVVLLARAGLADSARSVHARAQQAREDPELLPMLAWGALELGARDSAASLLEAYIAPRRSARAGVLASTRFAAIRNYERLQALLVATERSYARAATGR